MKKSKIKKDTISVDITKVHGFINDSQNKVVADVSWNDQPKTLDIRRCWTNDDGEITLGKGISLTEFEVENLRDILNDVLSKKKKPVKFSAVFEEAPGIIEKRDAGFTTEDGFIKLIPRGKKKD